MDNVLLINTSFRKNYNSKYSSFGPPMGILSIASSLKKHRYAVELIDPQTDSRYMDRLATALTKPQLFVGMSTYLGENIKHAIEFSHLIKKEKPNMPVVLGGPLASSIPEVFFNQMQVDYIVMGSGEETIVRIADALSASKDPRTIPNTCYKQNGEVTVGEMYVFDGHLDDLPLPALEEWEQGIATLKSIPIITSRGCHRGCAFCYNTFTGKRKFYLRSPENVIKEMEFWSSRFGINRFQFYDDNFLLNPNRALTILDEIAKRDWKVERLFGHLNEFDHVTPEQLAPSVIDTVICIESASLRIQKLLNKTIDIEKALDVIERIADQKINFLTAFMFGLPTETDEDIRLNIELAEKIRRISGENKSNCYIYAPQPKDSIINRLGPDQLVDFSLDALSEVEVVPVPPDNKIDLRLRPWMSPEDKMFYLDFVRVWQYYFAHHQDPNLDLNYIFSKNERLSELFSDIPPPNSPSSENRLQRMIKAVIENSRHMLDRFI